MIDPFLYVVIFLLWVGSIYGLLHYLQSKQLIRSAWQNAKKLRVVFFLFLLGPLTWVCVLLSLIPILIKVFTIYLLQEDPLAKQNESLPRIQRVIRQEENENDEVSD